MVTINGGTFNIKLSDLDKKDQIAISQAYNSANHNWSENYYTDPKVTHPSTKIDVPIPKEWVSSCYANDICPSFTHKILQIFVMDEQSRIDEQFPHKYSIMFIDDYGGSYDSLLTSNSWSEVIDFVNNYGEESNAN